MSKLGLGPVGVTLNVSADDRYLDEAAELEELGYAAIWLPGGQLDRLERIAKIARATTAIPVDPPSSPSTSTNPAPSCGSTRTCRPARLTGSSSAWAARSGRGRCGR